MSMKSIVLGFAAMAALSSLAAPAQAINLVTNGSFEETSLNTKGLFLNNVTGWTGGSHLTYLDYPGTATTVYLAVYAGFPAVSPDGGNFVEQDGDPSYSNPFSQVINGLVVGQSYTLTFWQAAGQQAGFTGPTTERWKVDFGGDVQLSSMYSLPQGGTGPWEQVVMNFTAHAVSQTLTFLAVGTPNGAPPISFLDGVNLEASVPEPAAYTLLAVGVAGVFAARKRRQKRT